MALEGAEGAFIDPGAVEQPTPAEGTSPASALNPRDFGDFGQFWVAVHAAEEAADAAQPTGEVTETGRVAPLPRDVLGGEQ
jgi:hypothetical protein